MGDPGQAKGCHHLCHEGGRLKTVQALTTLSPPHERISSNLLAEMASVSPFLCSES